MYGNVDPDQILIDQPNKITSQKNVILLKE